MRADQHEIDEDTYFDEWGTTWKKAQDGHYLYVDGPFFDQKKPDLEALENGDWPDPDNPGYYRGLRERAEKLRATECAVILNMPIGVVHQGQFLRGFRRLAQGPLQEPSLLGKNDGRHRRPLDRRGRKRHPDRGDNVDIVFLGDDLASQLAPLFNPEIYREIIKPRHARMIEAVKSRADVKVLYHSCGAVSPLIDDLIDIGVDAINPVQVTASDMEPEKLKERFGGRITFWGGVNTQETPALCQSLTRCAPKCAGSSTYPGPGWRPGAQ